MMHLFKRLRQITSRRRTRKQPPTHAVPWHDYMLLKQIRMTALVGDVSIIDTQGAGEAWHYKNAQMLHEHYGVDSDTILQCSGFWVEGSGVE